MGTDSSRGLTIETPDKRQRTLLSCVFLLKFTRAHLTGGSLELRRTKARAVFFSQRLLGRNIVSLKTRSPILCLRSFRRTRSGYGCGERFPMWIFSTSNAYF